MAEYYVYSLSYPDGTPFYIGKGKGNRIKDHGTTRGRLPLVNAVLAKIKDGGGECLRAVLKSGMTEDEAFECERLVIAQIGRHPNGPLVNSNDGGWGGRNPRPETREKLRQARLKQPNPSREHMVEIGRRRGPMSAEEREKLRDRMTGRVVSEETRRKISDAAKRRAPPAREHMVAMARVRNSNTSDETKEKLRQAAKRQVWTEDRRAKASAAQAGRTNSAEGNAKRSAALKGRKKTPEHLAAIAAAKAAKRSSPE